MPHHASQKSALRKILQEQRQALSPQDQALASQTVLEIFLEKIDLKQYQNIAAYLPMPNKGELDLNLLIQKLLDLGKNIYLPIIQKDSKKLLFKNIKNNFDFITPENLDLVLMPLVGFDAHGNRLGMGGGYYDTSFANNHKAYLLGVAYEFQELKINQIPQDPWDIKLHAVITHKNFYPAKD